MLSLKRTYDGPHRHRDSPDRHLNVALDRVVSILLQGISLHAFDYDPAEFASFQTAIRRLREEFRSTTDEDSALLLAGAAIHSLEQYGAATARCVSSYRNTMETAVRLLVENFLQVSNADPERAGTLRTIAGEFESLTTSGSAAERLNESLRTSLAAICDFRKASQNCPEGETSSPQAGAEAPGVMDTITGLPVARGALQAIGSSMRNGKVVRAFAFGVERLEVINSRFGFGAGDQILLLFAQHIARHLHPSELLFRWRGPSFIAITERYGSDTMLAAAASRIAGIRLEHSLVLGTREVTVPVVGSWATFTIPPSGSIADFTEQMDAFASDRTRLGGIMPQPHTH